MNKVFRIVLPALVLGILALGLVWAQEGGGGPSYGPGTVPTIPGTDVPVPAGDAVVAQDTGGSAPPAEGGSEGGGADAGTYVETRKDKVVFETTCLKCHPKEKILKRRTEPQWKDVVLVKHLLQGKIDSSVAAPVLRYLNENYGVKPKTPTPGTATPLGATPPTPTPAAPPTPAPVPPPAAAPAAPVETPPATQPAATVTPAPAPEPK